MAGQHRRAGGRDHRRERRIGLAVAKLLAAEGDTRVMTRVARNEANLGEEVAQLPGAAHDFIAAELSQPDGIDLVTWRLAARHHS